MMSGGGGGPCGACKFLRRKCVRGCVFAPYFDAEQGTARFAAVHKVFGASNASKMLMRLPSNKRLDAAVTLCYEALARLRDPVYGPVAHIFSLQHQVVNLQAELAYVQARLSTFQRLSLQPQPPMQQPSQLQPSPPIPPSLRWSTPSEIIHSAIPQMSNTHYSFEQSNIDLWEDPTVFDDGELQQVAMQFVAKYFPTTKLPASTSG